MKVSSQLVMFYLHQRQTMWMLDSPLIIGRTKTGFTLDIRSTLCSEIVTPEEEDRLSLSIVNHLNRS